MKRKLLIIAAWLVREAEEVSNEEIEKEVLQESRIPWVDRIEKVTVLEAA